MDGREFLAGYKAFADRGHPVPRFCKRRDLNISQYIVIYHVHRKTVRTPAFRLLREGPRGTGGLQGPWLRSPSVCVISYPCIGPERAAMMREMRATGRLLGSNLRDVTPAQAKELGRLFVDLRERILRILAG